MTWPPLADFVEYLPQVRALNLRPDELAAIPVHGEPASEGEFVSLGELPPGAPPIGNPIFRDVGTRQAYAYRAEVPANLWDRLQALAPRRPSGTGEKGMFGIPEEKVVDDETVRKSWRTLDAGAPINPEER